MAIHMLTKRTALAAILGLATAACSGAADTNDAAASAAAGDIPMGSADAPVEIVEYASTTCGHCRTFHISVLPGLKSNYIATGQAKYIFRDFPTPPARVAAAGGAIARCAGEAKYYDVIDDLFKYQNEILEATQRGGALDKLVEIGERAGLDRAAVEACVSDEDVLAQISANVELGQSKGVNSTPTVFVNGERVPPAEMSLQGISARIDAALGVAEAPAE